MAHTRAHDVAHEQERVAVACTVARATKPRVVLAVRQVITMARGDSKDSGVELTLQMRVEAALDGRPRSVGDEPLNELARSLADACETAALVRVWDVLGGSQGASPATWSAVERLHKRGKGRIPDGSIRLPAAATRTLAPARRLHKICKGRRLSARSVSADAHLARALEWVAAQRAAGRTLNATGGRPRSELAAELQAALRIDKEAARGLVTKLKRKKAL